MINYKKITIILLTSVILVSLGYLIDSDPPYENIWDTIFEFGILTSIIFTLIVGLFFLIKLTAYLVKKVKL